VTHSKFHNLPRASFLCLQHFCFSDPVIKCSLGRLCVLSIVSSDFSVSLCVFQNIISMPFNCYTSLCICCLLDAFTYGLRNYVCSSSSVSMPCSPNTNVDIAIIFYSLNWISLHILSSHCCLKVTVILLKLYCFSHEVFSGKDCASKILKCI
jgi:hypothetical protein